MNITRTLAAALLAVVIAGSACASETAPSQSPAPASSSVTSAELTGEVSTETVQLDGRTVTVPLGIRVPDDSVVGEAGDTLLSLSDEDPLPVLAAVTASAAEAGYSIYAQQGDTTVWIGHGNAVALMAIANAQVLTWGPDAAKDLLSS